MNPLIVMKSGTYEVFSVRDDGHVKWLEPGSESPSRSLFDSAHDAGYAVRDYGHNLIVREVPPRSVGTFYVRPKDAAPLPLPDHPLPG